MRLIDLLREGLAEGEGCVRARVRTLTGNRDAAQWTLDTIAKAYGDNADRDARQLYQIALAEVRSRYDAPTVEAMMSSPATLGLLGDAISRAPHDDRHVTLIKAVLDAGASVHTRLPANDSPLLCKAARSGSMAVAKLLLGRGADLECVEDANTTPLIAAVDEGHLRMVAYLLEQGADTTHCTSSGMDALLVAVSRIRDAQLVELLVGAGLDVNSARRTGQTPLTAAVESNNVPAIDTLVKAGADVDARATAVGGSHLPLEIAVAHSCAASTIALIRAGANVQVLEDINLENVFFEDQIRSIRSAVVENVIFRSASVPCCAENVHNGQNEDTGSLRSRADFSPL